MLNELHGIFLVRLSRLKYTDQLKMDLLIFHAMFVPFKRFMNSGPHKNLWVFQSLVSCFLLFGFYGHGQK